MLLAVSGLVAIAPSASAALSSGCQGVNSSGSVTGKSRIYWQQANGYSFSTGETVKVTFSNRYSSTPTTAHISLGTSAVPGDPPTPATWSSKASTTTFPATVTYTLDQDYTFLMFEIDDGNVDMDYECGTEQTITFASPGDQALATGTISLTATADSGLRVSLASSTTSVCQVTGTYEAPTLTLLDEGTCTITASQAGSPSNLVIISFFPPVSRVVRGEYFAADDVERSFTVSKVSQTITFAEPASQSLTTGSLDLSASASSSLSVSYASSTTSVCTVSGSTVSFVAAGTCSITASQSGDSTYAAATSVTRSFTIAAPAPSGGGGGGGGGAGGGGGGGGGDAPVVEPEPAPKPIAAAPTPVPVVPVEIPNPESATGELINAITPDQMAIIPPEVFGQLPSEALAGLKPEQASALTAAQVSTIKPKSARGLQPETIAALKPECVAALRPATVAQLQPAAIAAMSGDKSAPYGPPRYVGSYRRSFVD